MKPGSLYLVLLLLISFIEGGSLMAVELLAAKLIAPYYGTSLYVWASVLGITLAGIAAGYFTGGYISRSSSLKKYTLGVLLLSALFTFLVPFSAKWIMEATVESFTIISGSLLSSVVFLLPVIFLFGMVSPMLVQHLVSLFQPGKAAGIIYGVSTFGGIIATLFTGLHAIPAHGIQLTTFIFGGLMSLAFLLYMAVRGRYEKAI